MLITVVLLIIVFSIFYYKSYVYYYEGRNSVQNRTAKSIYKITESVLYSFDKSELSDDFIISSNKSFEMDTNVDKSFYDEMMTLANLNNIDYNEGVYYIEIRNKEVYKVIYADWYYSGYVGAFPNYNVDCNSYCKIVKKAYSEYETYINDKNINIT